MHGKIKSESMMGSLPVRKLLLTTGGPMLLSMLASSLFTLIDSIFVSHVSEKALTAIAMAAPIQTIAIALGSGIAIGLNAAFSKAMGEQDKEKAKETVGAAFFLAMCAWGLLVLICLLGVRPYFAWQSGGDVEIARLGVRYISVYLLFSFGQMAQWVFDRLVIATGKTHLFLLNLAVASGVSLILDPILIFGLFGLPAMETLGAAIATVVGQICGAVVGYFTNKKLNPEAPLMFTLRPKKERLFEILRVGVPTMVMQFCVSMAGMLLNTVLAGFSATAVAIYGLSLKVQNLSIVGINTINLGMIPVVAYNYGAKSRRRIEEAIRWGIFYAAVITGVFVLLLELIPGAVLRIFDASEAMLALGIPAIRLLAGAYLISAVPMIYATVFQGLGKGSTSMLLTLLRQAALPLMLVWLLSKSGNITLVWLGFVLAELIAVPVALLLYKIVCRKTLDRI